MHAKLLAVLGAIVLALVVVGALGAQVLREANARTDRIAELERKASFYRDLRDDLSEQLLAVTTALAGPSPSRFDDAVRQLDRAQLNLQRLPLVAADEPELADAIAQLRAELATVIGRVVELGRANRVTEARDLYLAQGTPIGDRLDRRVGELSHKAEVEILDAIEANHAAAVRSEQIVAAIAAAAVLVAGLLGLAMSLSIIRPVRDMDAALARIGAGDFSPRVNIPNRDELGTLGRNLNRMTAELGSVYAQLDAANRHKSEFLANMSHELRTPLNAIIGFSEVLLQRLFGELNPKQEEYLGDILSSGKHQLALVNDILDLSKVEAGKMDLELAPTSIASLIDSGILLVRERAIGHGIALSARVDPSVGTIDADERKLKQVVVNLLSNAVKYTPDGGRVEIVAERRDGEVRVSVTDTGVGIAPEDQARIFEEFQQTDVGRRTEASTGLGLSLARKLVELHGGRIWVESEAGKGSTFTFAVPVVGSARPLT